MAELTLRDPLNGAEIVEIILQEIEKRLKSDSTLAPDFTYAGFSAKFQINLSLVSPKPVETMVWGLVENEPETADSGPSTGTEVSDTYTAGAPNIERQEHDLPIPVLVATPAGSERRRVKIERAGKGK